MAGESERRRYLEWVRQYAEKYGYDYQEIDPDAYYDGQLSFSENKEIIRGAYPPVRNAEQVVQDEGKRNMDQYAKYANVEGARRRADEIKAEKASRKPSLLDRMTGWKEKNIDEPAKRRETEHYFKVQEKIKEHQERLKVKRLEQQERYLQRQEKELDREKFNASFAGRTIQTAQGYVGRHGRGLRSAGNPRPFASPAYVDSDNMRAMLSPNTRNLQTSSPLFSGSGNSVVLGLLTGKNREQRPKRHYITVIQHGVAKRVAVAEGQQYGQQSPQPAQQPVLNLFGGENNQLRERLALGRAQYGYSIKTRKPKFL